MVLDPLLAPALPAGLDPRWLYGLRSGVSLLAVILLWKHYVELKGIRGVSFSQWVKAVAVGTTVFLLWINLDIRPLAFTSRGGFDTLVDGQLHLGITGMRLAGAVLAVPLVEELFWRSFIFRWLHHPKFLKVDPGAVGFRALFISSALFATEHRLWFAGLLAGLAYGWLYRESRNLWPPIVAHAVTNGLLGTYVLMTGSWRFW
jgi:CAAX prenyl protease-like protein